MKRLILSAPEATALHRDGVVEVARAMNPQPHPGHVLTGDYDASKGAIRMDTPGPVVRCPFGTTGEVRWVAETWAIMFDKDPRSGEPADYTVERTRPDGIVLDIGYDSTAPYFEWVDGDGFAEYRRDGSPASRWKSAALMPQWASQATVTLTNQRVTNDDGVWTWRATATRNPVAILKTPGN